MNNAILIIDDEAQDIHLLSQMLLSEGYQLFAALNGRDGFQRALAHRPAVILLDLYMPDMDGLATARLIKSDPRLAAIPILFLTGSGALQDKLQAFTLGAVDYVTKPFSSEEVVARVRVHARLAQPLPAALATSAVYAVPAVSAATRIPQASNEAKSKTETETNAPPLTSGQRLVQQTQARLTERMAQTINLTALAHEVGTNERRLTTEFRQHTGMAVFEYLRVQRLRRACELLLHTELAVGSIGLQTGYSSSAAFSFAFRQHFGLTPSDYRNCAGIAPVMSAVSPSTLPSASTSTSISTPQTDA